MTRFCFAISALILTMSACSTDRSQPTDVDSKSADSDSTDKATIVPNNNFAVVDDFKTSASNFKQDTFDLNELSADGGMLIRFKSNDRDYLVFDAWLFGETGKIHATYWTDKEANIRIVEWTDFSYDKPYYEPGFKSISTLEFHSFVGDSYSKYDSSRKQVYDVRSSENADKVRKLFDAIQSIDEAPVKKVD